MESKVSSRLKQPLAQKVIQHIFLPRLNREFFANFDMLNQINFAHVLMLHAQGILEAGTSTQLAAALVKMQDDGPDVVALDPAREEAYFNYEARLMDIAGRDIGGRSDPARCRQAA